MSIRRDLKLAERRRDVAHMYLSGYKQVEIADKWRVSQAQISYDLKHIHAEWISAAVMDVGEVKARELARIDAMELEYWQAWKESKDPKKKESKTARRAIEGTAPYISEAREEIEERVGDSRYLDGLQWCVEQRLKIAGAYAPTKIAPTTPDGQSEWRIIAERHGLDPEKISEAVKQFRSMIESNQEINQDTKDTSLKDGE